MATVEELVSSGGVTWNAIRRALPDSIEVEALSGMVKWRADNGVLDWYSSESEPDWFIPDCVAESEAEALGVDLESMCAAWLLTPVLWREQRGYSTPSARLINAYRSQRPAIPAVLRQRVYERDGNQCLSCGAADDLSLDHIYPYSLGGPDTFANLQTLCRPCNSRKGVRV